MSLIDYLVELASRIVPTEEEEIKKQGREVLDELVKFKRVDATKKFFVVVSDPELRAALQALIWLAMAGLGLHVDSDLYRLKVRNLGRFGARRWIRPVTAHNEKMGYDWSVKGRVYLPSMEKNQPDFSSYKKILTAIDNPAKEKYTLTKEQFYAKLATNDNYSADRDDAVPVKLQGNDAVLQGLAERDSLKIQLNQKLEELQKLQEMYNKQEEETEEKVMSVSEKAVEYMQRMMRICDLRSGSDEAAYMSALIDPFSENSVGARVPQNIPEATFTYNEMEQLDVVTTAGVSTLIVWNPTILGGSKIAVYTGVNTMLTTAITETSDLSNELVLSAQPTSVTRGTISESDYQNQRLVAAGLKITKTSKADNESGVLRVMKSRRGLVAAVGDTLDGLMELRLGDKDYSREYLAGKSGDIIEVLYRPVFT